MKMAFRMLLVGFLFFASVDCMQKSDTSYSLDAFLAVIDKNDLNKYSDFVNKFRDKIEGLDAGTALLRAVNNGLERIFMMLLADFGRKIHENKLNIAEKVATKHDYTRIVDRIRYFRNSHNYQGEWCVAKIQRD